MTAVAAQRADLNRRGIPDRNLAGLAAEAALADHDIVTHLNAERGRASA